MKKFSKNFRYVASSDIGKEEGTSTMLSAFFRKHFGKVGMFMLFLFLSATQSSAQITVTLSTPLTIGAASMCPGTSHETIYAFTLNAAGIPPFTANLTGVSFATSGTATAADIIQYQLWSGSAGGTLVASSTTSSFSGFSTLYSGIAGTTINYWITADIASNAPTGRTIIVTPMTVANFTTSSGLKTVFGAIASGGAQTVLLAPTAITGANSVCVGSTTALSNGVSGGSWSSSNTALAAFGSAPGVVIGINDGSPVISYQLSTGCFTTRTLIVNPLPQLYSVTGGGSYCAGGTGVHVGLSGSNDGIYYQLYSGAITLGDPAGTGAALDFGLQTTAGVYTVVATDMGTSCSRNMAGSATVVVNPLPTVYPVTGGGSYCAGDAGLHVGLAGSNTGINYRLYRGTIPTGSPFSGTGSAMDFGIYTTAGNYTVMATNTTTNCTNDMAGSATVSVNPLPNVYAVTGGGNYCAGGAGVHVRLTWSQTGVIYVLYNGSSTIGSPVAGTGLPLDFGLQTLAGNYTVVAINATTFCSRNMAGSATVVVNPLPPVHAVTGGGSYCAGGEGLHVGLSSSDVGIMYMLYSGTTITGSPVPGTGSALDFGLQTVSSVYTIIGVNSATTCMNNMAGSNNIAINPLPNVYTVTGGGSYCAGGLGVSVGLSGSDAGIDYQLYHGSTPGTDSAGTGTAFNFGLQTAAGIYTVVATNLTTMCTKNMSGSASVIVNPLPTAHNVTGGGNYCTSGTATSVITSAEAGGTAIHVGLDGSDPGMIYILYNGYSTVGSPMAGTGAAIDFGVQYGSGTFTVLAIDATTLCTRNMTGSATITITPIVIPSVSLASGSNIACEGKLTTFNPLTINGGPAPTYAWEVNGTAAGTSPTYSYVPVTGDIVHVTMTSSALCAVPATADVTITMSTIAPVAPAVSITANPGIHVISGTQVTFTATITDGGSAPVCQWLVNGNPVAGATTITYVTSSLNNNDAVSCNVTRNDACALSASNSVVVTVNGVGVPEVAQTDNNITVMPNPSNGSFTIRGSVDIAGNGAVSLDITNMMGQVIYNKNVVITDGIINEEVKLTNMATGMYILNVRTANENKTLHVMIE